MARPAAKDRLPRRPEFLPPQAAKARKQRRQRPCLANEAIPLLPIPVGQMEEGAAARPVGRIEEKSSGPFGGLFESRAPRELIRPEKQLEPIACVAQRS